MRGHEDIGSTQGIISAVGDVVEDVFNHSAGYVAGWRGFGREGF